MYHYIAALTDDEVARGIAPLPAVIDTLTYLSTRSDDVRCGLITGNVGGIARRKMQAVGILKPRALAPPATDQRQWQGSDDIAFLGGFGSDYCSGCIDDVTRNYLDRSRPIEIAAHRCRSMLPAGAVLDRGDAPADVLAARAYAERADHPCCALAWWRRRLGAIRPINSVRSRGTAFPGGGNASPGPTALRIPASSQRAVYDTKEL